MARRALVPGVLAMVVIVSALVSGCAKPMPVDRPQTTIQTEHLTGYLYTKRTEPAKQRLDYIEQALLGVEDALAVTVTTRPDVRIYDGNNYPFTKYRWEVGRMTGGALYLSLDHRGKSMSEEDLCKVAVHEYVHFLVALRARVAGSGQIPGWLHEGVALYYADQEQTLVASRVRPVAELSPDSDSGAYYSQSLYMARQIIADFGSDRLLAAIDAYASGKADGVKEACGISEGELVERVRASLSK